MAVESVRTFVPRLRARLQRARALLDSRKHVPSHPARDTSYGRMFRATIETFSFAVESCNPQFVGHAKRVETYAVAIGRELGWNDFDLEGLAVAALLHDIGRLGIPHTILGKPDGLTTIELEKVRNYAPLGASLLERIEFAWPISDMIRHHRERYDGAGYPDGTSGHNIPAGARILSVADAYDSMVSERPHRLGVSRSDALHRIQDEAGTQFDPEVVAALAKVVVGVNARLDLLDSTEALNTAMLDIMQAQLEVEGLHDLANILSGNLDLDTLTHLAADRILRMASCSAVAISVADEAFEILETVAAVGTGGLRLLRTHFPVGKGKAGCVASTGEPYSGEISPDEDALGNSNDLHSPQVFRSTLIVPLRSGGRILGTLHLLDVRSRAFCADDLRAFSHAAQIAGRAIESALLYEETRESAFTDSLTGLRNGRYMRVFLDQELNRARKNGRELAVIGIDLDGFKAVNDTFGHARGDEVLIDIGRILSEAVRNYDLAARSAGDEFVLALPETSAEDAEIVASKIQRAISRYANQVREEEPQFPQLGASCGIAVFPTTAQDSESLLNTADMLMYSNKRERKAA